MKTFENKLIIITDVVNCVVNSSIWRHHMKNIFFFIDVCFGLQENRASFKY